MNVHATQPAGRHVATFLQDGVEIASTLVRTIHAVARIQEFGVDRLRGKPGRATYRRTRRLQQSAPDEFCARARNAMAAVRSIGFEK
jgi:hypothetical protein